MGRVGELSCEAGTNRVVGREPGTRAAPGDPPAFSPGGVIGRGIRGPPPPPPRSGRFFLRFLFFPLRGPTSLGVAEATGVMLMRIGPRTYSTSGAPAPARPFPRRP